MEAKSIFISIFFIILIINFIYVASTPDVIFSMGVGVLIGFALSITPIIVLGATALGSQVLSESAQKIIIGLILYLNIFFQFNIWNITIGLGLLNNVYLAFGGETLWGMGFMVTTILTIVTFITGLMVVLE